MEKKLVDQHSSCPLLKPQLNQPFQMFKCWVGGIKSHVFWWTLSRKVLEKLFQLKGGSCYIQHIAFIQRIVFIQHIVYIQHIVFLQILTVSTENWMAADLAKTK